MATATTETTQQSMTPQLWFEGGGQMEELQRISTIKDAAKKQAALQQFNETNSDFLNGRFSGGQPPPLPERAKSHPAIDEAINDAMKREPDWMRDIGGMKDDELRHRYMARMLEKDIDRKRVDKWTSLREYTSSRPDLVELSEKFTRTELERKEVLSRMMERQGFNVSKAKVEYERKLDPNLVATAELNINHRRLGRAQYNDVLFAEVSQVKKTLGNAKTAGFKP
jgi:hypothetical protein